MTIQVDGCYTCIPSPAVGLSGPPVCLPCDNDGGILPLVAPTVVTLTPTTLPIGGPAAVLEVGGANFTPRTTILWDGKPVATMFVSPTVLRTMIQPRNEPSPRFVPVSARTGSLTAAQVLQFEYTAAVATGPRLIKLTPNTAPCLSPDVLVYADGVGFTTSSIVNWDGREMPTGFLSSTRLQFTINPSTVPQPYTAMVTVKDVTTPVSGVLPFYFTSNVLTLTSITPDEAVCLSADVRVTVTGVKFTGTTVVLWDGAAMPTTYVSATEMQFNVHPSTVPTPYVARVQVREGSVIGTGEAPFTFTVAPSILSITALTPTSARCGDPNLVVTATGTKFTATTELLWDGVAVPTTYISPTSASFIVKPSVEPVPRIATVTVQDNFTGRAGKLVGQGAVNFAFTSLSITSIAPNTAPCLSADLIVTATGTNFTATTVILVDGAPVPTNVYINGVNATFTIKPSLEPFPRLANITVRDGSAAGTGIVQFQFTAATNVLTITAVNPNTSVCGSPQITATATGVLFTNTAAIHFDGTPVATTYISPTSATFPVNPVPETAARTAQITVKDGATNGVGSIPYTFTLTKTLSIVSLLPVSAVCGSARVTVTATGTNFTANTVLMMDGVDIPTTFVDATTATFIADPSIELTPRTANITVKDGSTIGTGTVPFQFTQALTITAINPNTAVIGTADITVTATGTGFTAGTILMWDGVDAATTFVNATTATWVVRPTLETAARVANVTVKDATQTGTGTVPFTFTVVVKPVVTTVVPDLIGISDPAKTITVTGTGFEATSVVTLDAIPQPTTFVSATSLTFQTNPAQSSNWEKDLRVRTGPIENSSNAVPFTCITTPKMIMLVPNTIARGGADLVVKVLADGQIAANMTEVLIDGTVVPSTWVSTAESQITLRPSTVTNPTTIQVSIRVSHPGHNDNLVPVTPPLTLPFTFT